MYTPQKLASNNNEAAFRTPEQESNFRQELKQALYERNLLTARTRNKIGDMLDENSSPKAPNDRLRLRNFRLQAVEEILTSERSYVKQLETLIQYFVRPLKERQIVDAVSHNVLFGQVETIYQLNSELLRELETNMENVAQAFIKFAPFLKLYSVYAFDYRTALLKLQELTTKNSQFRQFLADTETRPEVQCKLNSLMIVPVQRVPRYRLLLKQVQLYTSATYPDWQSLHESVKQIESIAQHINSCFSVHEETQTLINLQNSLVNRLPSIVKPSRKIIKEGVLKKIARNGEQIKRYCVLMSDIFMYCKQLKERAPSSQVEASLECCCIFPLKKSKVHELFPGNFKLTCQSDAILLGSEDVDLVRSWVSRIRDAIEEHIECRKTLRKESSKRKPIRHKDVKHFEAEDNIFSPSSKKKAEYETVFRNRSDSDSESEQQEVTSNSCFSNIKRSIFHNSPTTASAEPPQQTLYSLHMQSRKRPLSLQNREEAAASGSSKMPRLLPVLQPEQPQPQAVETDCQTQPYFVRSQLNESASKRRRRGILKRPKDTAATAMHMQSPQQYFNLSAREAYLASSSSNYMRGGSQQAEAGQRNSFLNLFGNKENVAPKKRVKFHTSTKADMSELLLVGEGQKNFADELKTQLEQNTPAETSGSGGGAAEKPKSLREKIANFFKTLF